jgi:hypothetical protein
LNGCPLGRRGRAWVAWPSKIFGLGDQLWQQPAAPIALGDWRVVAGPVRRGGPWWRLFGV